MSHRRKVWIVYALFLAVVVAAMGWASWTVLRLDRAGRRAQQQAQREELIRLALWRMDAALSALVAAESARPFTPPPMSTPEDTRRWTSKACWSGRRCWA